MAKAKDEKAPAEEVVAEATQAATEAASEVTEAAEAKVAETKDAAAEVDEHLAAFEALERDSPELFANAKAEAEAAAKDALSGIGTNAIDAQAANPSAPSAASAPVTSALGTSDPNESHDGLAATVAQPATSVAEQATQIIPPAVVPAQAPQAQWQPQQQYAPGSPILVPAPEQPEIRGNRAKIALIGIFAALAFAILYFFANYVAHLVDGRTSFGDFVPFALEKLQSLPWWTPTIAFFLGFWFLGLFINRAKWGKWVFFSFIPGLFAWGGVALGAMIGNEFWKHSTDEMVTVASTAAISFAGLAAFLIGREVTVWFSKWAAHSGAKRIAEHEADLVEYERVIEAGPQL